MTEFDGKIGLFGAGLSFQFLVRIEGRACADQLSGIAFWLR